MKMYLTLAWRNIWRNKRRSLITIVSVTFAVLLACFMRSIQLGSYDRMIANAARFYTGHIQIHKQGFWNDKSLDNSMLFDRKLLAQLDTMAGVEVAVPRLESFALASYGTKTKGALVMGVDPVRENLLTQYRQKLVAGHDLQADDRSVLIGEGLARYLKLDVGDTLTLLGQGYHGANAAGLYPVKGILKFPVPEQNNQTVFLPLASAQWFYAADNRLTSIALVVDKARHVDRIVNDLRQHLDAGTYEVMGWRELMPDLVQGIEIDNLSGRIMLWLLYAVIGFGMFGTFLMMTAERMYEFGVMMAIGMSRLVMQAVIFLEMAMMAALGVLSGIGISLPVLIYFYHHPIYLSGDSAKAIEAFGLEPAYFFSLEPALFYNQAWAIFFMAFILGFYPLYVIARLRPVEAMHDAL